MAPCAHAQLATEEEEKDLSLDAGQRSATAVCPIPGERRGCYDRRTVSLRSFVQGGVTPRRRRVRRADEASAFVDWHEPHLLFMAMTILLLSVADAFLTLTLLTQGGQEANPLLAYVLDNFPRAFAGVKMLLTGIGVVVLVALARATVFRIIRVVTLMHWCLVAYVILIFYEWWLLRSLF